jgi:hypothetical protein
MSDRPLMGDPPLVRDQTMSEPPEELGVDLVGRLDELQDENRRLRRLGITVLGAGALLLLGAAVLTIVAMRQMSTATTVHARGYVLEDAAGQIRGAWGVTREGGVQLVLADAQGKARVRVSALEDGSPGLALVDANGQSRAAMGLLSDGTITLVFADPEGHSRAVLGLTASGASSLALADGHGVTRAGLGVAPNGKPTVTVDPASNAP